MPLILSIIHTVTIGTILNNIGVNNGHGLKTVTSKQSLIRGCCIHSIHNYSSRGHTISIGLKQNELNAKGITLILWILSETFSDVSNSHFVWGTLIRGSKCFFRAGELVFFMWLICSKTFGCERVWLLNGKMNKLDNNGTFKCLFTLSKKLLVLILENVCIAK